MKNLDYNLFRTIARFSEKELYKFLVLFLRKQGYTSIIEDKNLNYIYAIGDYPVGLVAHIDTVFYPCKDKDIYFDKTKKVMWSPQGLGADDRAGVFAIMELLRQFKDGKPSIIFTNGEESGLIGAQIFIEDFPLPASPINYLIELDRRGEKDCVFYDCGNPHFHSYIESFGFKTREGLYSDICVICEEWQIAGVNLSVGYFDEHSICEILNFNYLYSTIKKTYALLMDAANITEPFDYMPPPSYHGRVCDGCGEFFHDWEVIPLRENGKPKWYCDSCITQCNKCGKEIGKSTTKDGLCAICAKEGDKK